MSEMSRIKGTSPGQDNIPYWFYKTFSAHLAPVITVIFNKILQTGTFPPAGNIES